MSTGDKKKIVEWKVYFLNLNNNEIKIVIYTEWNIPEDLLVFEI